MAEWMVAEVAAGAPATGGMVSIVNIHAPPPIKDYVAAWGEAGAWRKANPGRIYIVIERP